MSDERLAELERVRVSLKEGKKRFSAVNEVSFSLTRGRTMGIIGESGCGKTLLCHALLGLLAKDTWEIGGDIRWNKGFSGRDAGFIVQDPASAFDPRMKLWGHFGEMAGVLGLSQRKIREKALWLLCRMGLREPERVLDSFAFELSGGMLQRVMIALALLGNPKLLVADEPTTALDVTTQWEILGLLGELKQEYGLSILLVSHDLNVIQSMAEDICVMYAGYVVEQGRAEAVLRSPGHPYTRGLLASRPAYSKAPIQAMEGRPPGIRESFSGCPFALRCKEVKEICWQSPPPVVRCEVYPLPGDGEKLSDRREPSDRGNLDDGRKANRVFDGNGVHQVRCHRAGEGENR